MGTNWIKRKYREGDERGIIDLFENTFGKPKGKTESLKAWEWEFKSNPAGRLAIYLAEDNGRIVGQYTAIPLKMKVGDDEVIGSLSVDTMTHSEYRGKSMFPILARSLYKEVGDSDIHMTYGFPNRNSINGFIQKLSWKGICNFPLRIRPLRFDAFFRKMTKGKLLLRKVGRFFDICYDAILHLFSRTDTSIKIEQIHEFGDEFNALWSRCRGDYRICLVRDSAYLNWRFILKPEGNYHVFRAVRGGDILGYIVLKCDAISDFQTGFIVDILAVGRERSTISSMVQFAIQFFREREMEVVSCLMLNNNPYCRVLRRFGFVKVPSIFFPQEIYFGARVNTEKYPIEFITNKKKWYITWGDTDIV